MAMWTPKSGTQDLARHVGHDNAFILLTCLLAGELPEEELTTSPSREAICLIGNGHAQRLLREPINSAQLYWTRVWAARSLAYLGDTGAADWLVAALDDAHWRIRMTAAQTLGRLRVEGIEDILIPLLNDEHERVRGAAATALGCIGNEFALEPLQQAFDDEVEVVREKADRALAKIEKRVRGEG